MSKPKPSKPEEATLQVKVVPRSSRTKVAREPDGTLKVWVTAPPVDGEANDAVCSVIAETLHVAKSAVRVINGHSHRNKTLLVNSISASEATERLRSKGL